MGARSAVATAWLATEHQQLMYLLSPEGKTVFYIPGVEVVHKVSTPINLPDEASKTKMEPGKMQPPPGGSRKRAWSLPRPQLCLRKEEQAGAEPAQLPGRADAQAHLPRAREVPHPEPHPSHPNPLGLHLPKVSDGRASDVCKRF